ncbi:uncharacterized protein B0H18DRAFT_1008526 [Fomitopsis serialis]|uniref:uncharacterized protein n=1 Tax=Fomitopsis serialis TaxID=139415 RepID=UPI0020085643|nr:uncharacterized protein B0H18DRAFT_1008526 [Neoantrodia serialis]KAH9925817.1 hypothetical protein B0H18DRAFT_1008526 [Neoantrodia serialis]
MLRLVERANDVDSLQATKEQYTLNYCAAAGTVLLLYDYVITLGQESRFVWTDVRAGYAVIFLANRLNMLCMFISGILSICSWHTVLVGPTSSLSCTEVTD